MQTPMHQSPPSSTSLRALSVDGSPLPARWVEEVFERLSAILGSGMANVYAAASPERVRQEWAEALGEMTAQEIKRGLAAARTRKFAPNLGEFLHLCRPALDPEVAWSEAEEGVSVHADGKVYEWSHPAVYWAAREMQFELRSGSYESNRKRWTRLLERQWQQREWLIPPDPTVKRIAAPEQKFEPCPPDVKAKLEALRKTIGASAPILPVVEDAA